MISETLAPEAPVHEGYRSGKYAQAMDFMGTPHFLCHAGGWLMERPINNTPYCDLTHAYPLFDVDNWSALNREWAALDHEKTVSVTVVCDPFASVPIDTLYQIFPDRHQPFKMHYFAALDKEPAQFVSSGHRYKIRRALRDVRVRIEENKELFWEEWCALYASLIEKHGIQGVARFTPDSFKAQLTLPDMHLIRAVRGGETVAMHLWIEKGDRVYYHLGASTDAGYKVRASYAVMWEALHYFRSKGSRLAVLGGVAGLRENPRDGLARYKRGFATGKLPSMLCGKIINRGLYDRLSKENGVGESAYFPKYRFRATGEHSE